MIVEIPDAADFSRASINLLNLAWQVAFGSLDAFENSNVIHPLDLPSRQLLRDDGSIVEIGGPDLSFTPEQRAAAELEYWRRSQPALGNALSLIQQAIELAFKGRIATVSPFLLIVRDARDFPRGSTEHDIPFSAFRTLDAADLMRVHNSVCSDRLSDDFGIRWDQIRRQRNALIHSVAPKTDLLHPLSLIENLLAVSKTMHGDKSWFRHRLDYALNDEIEAAYEPDPPQRYGSVLVEFSTVIAYLGPRRLREHFGLDCRARSYICVHCMADCDGETWYSSDPGRHAQLAPRGPRSTNVRCGVCGRSARVMREACGYPQCKSNVLSCEAGSFGICLLCGEGRPEPEED